MITAFLTVIIIAGAIALLALGYRMGKNDSLIDVDPEDGTEILKLVSIRKMYPILDQIDRSMQNHRFQTDLIDELMKLGLIESSDIGTDEDGGAFRQYRFDFYILDEKKVNFMDEVDRQ